MRNERQPETRSTRTRRPAIAIEPLERRVLLAAAAVPAATGNSIAALYGGSLHFNAGTVTTQRHVTVRVDSQTNDGALVGTLRIDGLQAFPFTGTATNQLVFLVFNGPAGSGALLAKQDASGAAGDLRGELSATINGVSDLAQVRLHDNGGVPSDTAVATPPAAGTASVSNPASLSGLAGNYTGTVRLEGTDVRSAPAILNLSVDPARTGLFDGTFSVNTLGLFQVSGSQFGDNQTVVVFTNRDGSGAMVLDDPPASGFAGLSGSLFALAGGRDVHGVATLNTTVIPPAPAVGQVGVSPPVGTSATSVGVSAPSVGVGSPAVGVSSPQDVTPTTGSNLPPPGIGIPPAGVGIPTSVTGTTTMATTTTPGTSSPSTTTTAASTTTMSTTPGAIVITGGTTATTTSNTTGLSGLALGGVPGLGSPFSNMIIT